LLTNTTAKTDKDMMKSLSFFCILLLFTNSLSNASVNNGLYDVNFVGSTSAAAPAPSSEITTPVVEASMAPASAVSPPSRPADLVEAPTVAPAAAPAAAAPARDFTVSSAGGRADHGEELVNVRSCNSIVFIEGARTNSNRGGCDDLKTARSFVDVLMRQLPICIAEGVRASGISKAIKKTKIYNAGSLRTRPSSGGCRSLHYAARALDIWGMDVIFDDNTSLYTRMHIDHRNRPFYKEFNKCWERETEALMRRLYPNNTRCHNYDGLIDCSDRDHQNHIHASFPYCPKKSGFCSI
jgi:hypothetical protein